MGSPLAPILANRFVSKIEAKLLSNPDMKQPKFYRRYVDDMFAVLESEEDRDVFYKHLKQAHNNVEFTMENVDTSSKYLPFLHVDMKIGQANKLETKAYRKPTSSNIVVNFEAMVPTTWKKVRCFLARTAKVSSSRDVFEDEVAYLKKIVAANGYPMSFIQLIIHDYIKEIETDGKQSKRNLPENDVITTEQYFVLSYVGKASEKLQKKVKKEIVEQGIGIGAA